MVFKTSFTATHRTINCMVGQMKHILATEQKKTDFRPEDENNVMIQYTTVSDTRPLLPSSKQTIKHSIYVTSRSENAQWRLWTCLAFRQDVSNVSPPPAGLLQGVRLRQSAGGARAEVHGREKRGYSADGAGCSFPPAHPRAPTAVQLQLHGRHAGHLRRGWIPTVRQGLQGEWKGHRSKIQWSQD